MGSKALACAWGLLLTLPVLAMADSIRFSIAAQPLPAALKAFAAQANMQLLYRFEAVESAKANAVIGDFEKRAALEMLLDGTGLEAVYSKDDAATIRPTQTASKPTVARSTNDYTHLAQANNPETPGTATKAGWFQRFRLAQNEPSSQTDSPSSSKENPSQSSDKNSEGRVIDEVVVTGSRLRLGAEASAAPVTIYDRAQIERLGITTAGEILRVLPQNQGVSTTSPYGTLGASRFPNLRGLGEGTTLVLINGQRVASSGISLGFGSAVPAQFNLDVIPISAIDRIEVLRDGASAIYGADAIGGVINVIMRRSYSGAEVSAKYLAATSTDLRENSYSGVFGKQVSRLSMMVGGEYYDRDALIGSERPYIATLDKRAFGGTNLTFPGSGVPVPANVSALPGTGNLPGLNSTFAAAPGGTPRALQVSDFVGTQGQSNSLVDFTAQSAVLSPQERSSGFGRLEWSISDAWAASFDALYSGSTTTNNPSAGRNNRRFGAANPYNPFGVDTLVSFDLATTRSGIRTRTQDYSGSLGLTGQLTATWQVRGSMYFAESRFDELEWATDFGRIDAALLSADPVTALNPFFNGASNSRALLDSLVPVSLDGKTTVRAQGASVSATGAAFALPSGPVEVALGAETRQEKFDTDTANFLANTRRIVHENRYIGATYLEFGIPLLNGEGFAAGVGLLDLSLAARYEKYSDFGDTTNPKIGIRWRPIQGLAFRATWGTAFQAPSLSQLYTPATFTRGSFLAAVSDPVLNQSYRISNGLTRRGNADLRPQEADTSSAGLTYEHPLGRGSWNASVDLYRIDFSDRIRSGISPQEMVDLESLFPQNIIRDPATGRITDVISTPINVAEVNTAGIDFSLGLRVPLLRGAFDANLAGTLVDKYDLQLSPILPVLDRQSFVGFSNRLKGNLQLQYSAASWSAGATVFYAHPYRSDRQPGVDIRSQTTVDLQFTYQCCGAMAAWLEDLRLTLGVINLFDREPPFYNNFFAFDMGEGDPLQRRVYARVSAAF